MRLRRYVAIHPEVVEALVAWQAEGRAVDVRKFVSLMRALLGSDQTVVDYQLKRNAVQPIAGTPGLFEVGPKRGRGGLPRLFLTRRANGAWLVAAGMEKSGHGARELKRASDRSHRLPDDPVFPASSAAFGSTRFHVLWTVGDLGPLGLGDIP